MQEIERPYVIENVEGARWDLTNPVRLCGSSFGLRVRRHRLFETNWPLTGPPCAHEWQDRNPVYTVRISKKSGGSRPSGVIPVFGHLQLLFDEQCNTRLETDAVAEAMGIGWTPSKWDMNQAIPPAYTKHIGTQLRAQLEA